MRKNVNGAGSICYESGRQKWKAFYTTPAGRRISKRFASKKEAQEWLSLNAAAAVTSTFVEPSALTVGSWLVSYLRDYKAGTIAPKTMDLYTLLAGKCAPIADVKLQSVTGMMIQSFYTELKATQSVEMIRKLHRFLHSAFEKALRLGLIATNVISLADPPKRTDKKEIETFTREEIDAVYRGAREYSSGRYYAFVQLAFTTGARLGELLALCWDCVDAKESTITIKRNITSSLTAGLQVSQPKTQSGIRTISIPADVMKLLIDMRRKADVVSNFVFTTSTGTPFSPRNFQRIWANIVKHAGISHKNFHVIRHTHATELLAAGVPIADVSRRLGHAKISHTLDLYGHAIPRLDREISDKVASLFSANCSHIAPK